MSILKYIEREWLIAFIHNDKTELTVAEKCPWGHASVKENISEGTCTHTHNCDPIRTKFITFGRCVESYCPIKRSILEYKKE